MGRCCLHQDSPPVSKGVHPDSRSDPAACKSVGLGSQQAGRQAGRRAQGPAGRTSMTGQSSCSERTLLGGSPRRRCLPSVTACWRPTLRPPSSESPEKVLPIAPGAVACRQASGRVAAVVGSSCLAPRPWPGRAIRAVQDATSPRCSAPAAPRARVAATGTLTLTRPPRGWAPRPLTCKQMRRGASQWRKNPTTDWPGSGDRDV